MKSVLPQLMKLLIAIVLVVSMLPILPQKASAAAYDSNMSYQMLDIRFWEDQKPPIGFYINASARYILETVTEPKMGSTYGEWSVMDLLRAKYTGYDYINYIPPNYFDNYVTRIDQYVKDHNGVLDRNKSTEWSRLTLSMSALGRDIRNIAGYDFVNELSKSHAFSYKQGINGPIWEIIALNTGGYQLYENPSGQNEKDVTNTVGLMIDYILAKEITQNSGELGGWALTGKIPDPDITGMAIQSLAPYYLDPSRYAATGAKTSYEEFAKAVERGVVTMANMQLENGGFSSWGTSNSESTVQIIVALTALNIDPLAPSITLPHLNKTVDFITEGGFHDGVWSNNVIDALLMFWAAGSGSSPEVGGFKHVTSGYDGGGGAGVTVNAMATDQALYGLIAYDRFLKNKNSLYDMTDMINGEYRYMDAVSHTVTFDGNAISSSTSLQKSPYAVITLPSSSEVYSWNTKADGTGVKYMPGEKLVMPEHSITLYAQSQATTADDNMASVQAVIDMISDLPSINELTRDHQNIVKFATTAYNKLTADEKKLVTNHSELALIEGKLQQLLAQYDDELKVTNLILTIDSLAAVDPLTEDYEIAIHNARRAYNALTAAQRLQITNLSKLEILEAKIAILIDIAKQEHQAAIDAAATANKPQQQTNEITNIVSMITALPTLQKVTLNDLMDVRKVRIFVDGLSQAEQLQITNLSALIELEKKLEQLSKEALEKEDFENDVNEAIDNSSNGNATDSGNAPAPDKDNTTNTGETEDGQSSSNTDDKKPESNKPVTNVAEATIKGKQLVVEASKVAGSFDVTLNKEMITTINDFKLKTVKFIDARNVEITMEANELLQNFNKRDIDRFQIYISQYDYDTGLFEVKLKAIDSKGTEHQIQTDKTYIEITIPYNFFVDGLRLQDYVVFKVEGNKETAVPHLSKNNELTLKLKSDGIYKFKKNEVNFSDISNVSMKDDIIYLAQRGVISSAAQQFNPQQEINRGQFALMLTRALGLEAKANEAIFKDVQGKEYELAVQALYEAGITGGSNGQYNPGAKLTRQQAALMMARVLRYTGFNTADVQATSSFKDGQKISKEAMQDISVLNALRIMTGNTNGEFMPQKPLTRAQMAKILKGTLNITEMM